MSKAEDRALEAYPVKEEWVGNQYGGLEDVNKLSREKYTEGYHQAEKDLELTWKDILLLADIEQDVFCHSDSPLKGVQAAYEEILKRFNETKEK